MDNERHREIMPANADTEEVVVREPGMRADEIGGRPADAGAAGSHPAFVLPKGIIGGIIFSEIIAKPRARRRFGE